MDPVLLTALCFAHLSANTMGVFSDCKSSALTEVMAIAAPITEALFLKNKQLLISNKSLIFLFLEPAMTIKLIPGSHSHILSLSLSLTHTHTHTHIHACTHARTHAYIHTVYLVEFQFHHHRTQLYCPQTSNFVSSLHLFPLWNFQIHC